MGLNSEYAKTEPSRTAIDALEEATILEFGSPDCRHCLAAQPLIAQAFAGHPRLGHIKIEDGRGRPLGRSFAVKLWPTLIFLRQGKEVERLVRPTEESAIEQALARLDS